MAVQVLGKVAYFNKGAYNSQTNYEINDVVSYNGSSYVSLNDNNQGNLPTNTNYWSVVAEKGDKGDTGKPFVIEKTYSTIESMVADYDNMNVNDYVMIQGSIEEQENATLWTKREVEVSPYKWAYLADFSGASGITGATPNIHIGTVTEGNEPSVTRRSGSSNENPILDFVLKTGAKGDTGATGNGISSIEKTSTSGLVDTYTITFTNGTSTTIEVTNGRGIVSIAKTSSVDYVDTYTITYNDGTTSTFEVANSEVTEEEFNDVVDELNYLYDDLPKVEGEGTSLTLDNTRKGKMSTMLKGNLSQFTTTGKNKLNSLGTYSAGTTRTSNGVDYTFNSDGSITINGTATGTSFALLIGESLNDYQTEKFRINEDYVAGNWSNANIQLTTRGTDGEYRTIYKGSNPDIVNIKNIPIGVIFVQVATNATVNETIYPQIELGNTQTSYEKFTGGNPAPNPDYPQDVHVVSGNNEITIANSDNSESQTYPINLGTMELCKIEDYQDYIYKNDDKWYKQSEIGKIVLNGSENWNRGSGATTRSVYTLDTFTDRLSSNNRDDFYSDNFSYLGNTQGTDLGYAMSFNSNQYSNYLYIQIPTDIVEPNNITAFKQWLSTHNTIVYYVLATPTNTEITDQTLIAQLDNFEKAISYNTQTNISQENNDLPFIISASAFMSLKYLFGNLETRVAELEG